MSKNNKDIKVGTCIYQKLGGGFDFYEVTKIENNNVTVKPMYKMYMGGEVWSPLVSPRPYRNTDVNYNTIKEVVLEKSVVDTMKVLKSNGIVQENFCFERR